MDILSFQEAATRKIDQGLTTEGHVWASEANEQPRLSLYDPYALLEPPVLRLVCASDEQ